MTRFINFGKQTKYMKQKIHCPYFCEQQAHKIHLPVGTSLLKIIPDYKQEKGLVICEIETCIYDNQGQKILFADSDKGLLYHCKTNGFIKTNRNPEEKPDFLKDLKVNPASNPIRSNLSSMLNS